MTCGQAVRTLHQLARLREALQEMLRVLKFRARSAYLLSLLLDRALPMLSGGWYCLATRAVATVGPSPGLLASPQICIQNPAIGSRSRMRSDVIIYLKNTKPTSWDWCKKRNYRGAIFCWGSPSQPTDLDGMMGRGHLG